MDPQGDSGTGLRPESFRIREAVHHVGYGSGHLRDQMGGRQRLDSCHAYDLEDIFKIIQRRESVTFMILLRMNTSISRSCREDTR